MTTPRFRFCAFSLVELLTATAVGALLLVTLGGLLGSSLQTMAQTIRSVQVHDATTQLVEALHSDLRDLTPPSHAVPQTLLLKARNDEVVLAVVRPDPRFLDLQRQGYYRHVEYRWNREDRTLIRSVYHSAEHPVAAGLSASPDSSNHQLNAERLAALTPAMRAAWLDGDEMQTARELAAEAPLASGVEEFSVECLVNKPPGSTGQAWTDQTTLPTALRVQIGFRPASGQAEPRRFTLLVPVQTRPHSSR